MVRRILRRLFLSLGQVRPKGYHSRRRMDLCSNPGTEMTQVDRALMSCFILGMSAAWMIDKRPTVSLLCLIVGGTVLWGSYLVFG